MKDKRKVRDEALSIIDAALTILNKFPPLKEGEELDMSISGAINPFAFLLELFKTTAGYDYLIRILGHFIASGLPALELGVKGVLLANMKNLLSTCTVQPLITDELLRRGVAFSLPQIDICDTLKYSPLSSNGKHYYFGCSGCKCPDDVRDTAYYNRRGSTVGSDKTSSFNKGGNENLSDIFFGTRDMNALLWYMKSRASHREIWGRKSPLSERNGENDKQKKKDGIITLDFVERPTSLKNAEGNSLYIQTPDYNILQVFIGNAAPINIDDNNIKNIEINAKQLYECSTELAKLKDNINNHIQNVIQQRKRWKRQVVESTDSPFLNVSLTVQQDTIATKSIQMLNYLLSATNGGYGGETDAILSLIKDYNSWIQAVDTQIDVVSDFSHPPYTITIPDIEQRLTNLAEENANAQYSASQNFTYRKVDKNYYHNRTLLEFNFDYIFSLKLFDEKVVIAQLLDQLVKCVQMDFNLSYKQIFIKEKIEEMITRIVETDDTEVDDCFFTFSNDKYDEMLRKAELRQAGLYTPDGSVVSTTPISIDTIMDSLNGIDESASESKVQEIIEGSIKEVSGAISSYQYNDSERINGGVQINFIENLLNNLAFILVSAVLSPKVYLLILINLQILGENTNFDLDEFIDHFKNLIVALIRQIRDKLIEYLVTELQKLLGELAAQVAFKLTLEQAMYYKRLIKKIIDCIKLLKGKNQDFTIDDAVVDIYQREVSDTPEPLDNNCSTFK